MTPLKLHKERKLCSEDQGAAALVTRFGCLEVFEIISTPTSKTDPITKPHAKPELIREVLVLEETFQQSLDLKSKTQSILAVTPTSSRAAKKILKSFQFQFTK